MFPFGQFLKLCVAGAVLLHVSPAFSDISEPDIAASSLALFAAQGAEKQDAIDALLAVGDERLIPTFVLAMRWTGSAKPVAEALSQLTGQRIETWHQAFDWQQEHPEIEPHPTYRDLKLRFLGNTDKRFLDFLPDAPMKIRLEEILWGGVLVDGIPALNNPEMIAADQAHYMLDEDLVFGIEINGDERAYPLRIMGWHEMMNDIIGGVPVALTYCTLCGSGILFETETSKGAEPLIFGTSGLLYRSNKLMYDRRTRSLWNQFTGRPVVGAMSQTSIALRQRPMTVTTWSAWRKRHPMTQVLAIDTGFSRDYGSGVTYSEYFASPDLMFPAGAGDETVVSRKQFVFGIETFGAARAWPIHAFDTKTVINDRVGELDVVLIGDAGKRAVRAYRRNGRTFQVAQDDARMLAEGDVGWTVTEDSLVSDGGLRLPRIPGRLSYWFAWDNYYGADSTLYDPEN